MTDRELDAAGIINPALRDAYRHCRTLNARHGKTYFLATRLLPVERRPAVHALYGFARWADDIVDSLSTPLNAESRSQRLGALQSDLERGLLGGTCTDPVVLALADTACRYDINHQHFGDFIASMRSDLHVTDYPTLEDLQTYMYGSAAVIGLQMLPILGTVVPRKEAAPSAASLGVAFQMTNFLRDVGEDLDRGRVYLPADLLQTHGVDRQFLLWSRKSGRRDRRIVEALRAFEGLTRAVYREAVCGLAMLDPVSRPCIRTAFILYGGILDAIEKDGYAVLHRRAAVSRPRRAAVGLDGLMRAMAARATARTSARSPAARTPDHTRCERPHPASEAHKEIA
ncbi:phytoene/squalene synthase family protein [Streptomyces fagopyri]|uniref:phytoene/squalene synthase family protein n=1 Tax=Streptomyces fagopyri TaxID=2662397 RepID=UPI0033FF5898